MGRVCEAGSHLATDACAPQGHTLLPPKGQGAACGTLCVRATGTRSLKEFCRAPQQLLFSALPHGSDVAATGGFKGARRASRVRAGGRVYTGSRLNSKQRV